MTAQTHGGLRLDELAALGVRISDVVDFSASLNVYGPDPEVAAAARAAELLAYPDPTALPARRALATRAGVEPDAVVVGAGAAELLWSLARALLRPGAVTVIVEPAFAEWRTAAAATGAAIVAGPGPDLAVDLDAVARAVRTSDARAVYLANPGNPGGLAVPADALAAFARDLAGATVVLDEAFLSLSARHADADRPLPGNVVRVRSLTKDHGLAGLRIGYALAAPALARRIEAERPPWTVSAPAQAAAVAAAGRDDFVAACRARLLADRDHLRARLADLGLASLPSDTLYFLVEVGDATALRRRLLAHHAVAVRDATSFGLPDHVRVAARPAADVDRLVRALAQELPWPRPPR